MKNKVIKLCKRLGKINISEVLPILMTTESELIPILDELIEDKNLEKLSDGTYVYKEKPTILNELPLFFQFHTPYEIDFIVKAFCLGVKTKHTSIFLNISDATIQNFNLFFRKNLYAIQFNKLKEHFAKKPKTPRMRTFYDVPVYFYIYEKNIFVSSKPLYNPQEKIHSEEETALLKILYSRLRRSVNHSNMKVYMAHHIAEGIYRLNYNEQDLMSYISEKIINNRI